MKTFLRAWLALWLAVAPVAAAEINDLDITDNNNVARFPEGMTFANVNNSARALEGILARFYKDVNGSLTTGGTSNAYTLTANQTVTAYYAGLWVRAKASFSNSGAATLSVDSVGAGAIKKGGTTDVASGDILEDHIYDFVHDGTNWQVLQPSATPFQPIDALLTSIAGLTFGADSYIYGTGSDTAAAGTITSFGRSLVDDASATAARTTLGGVLTDAVFPGAIVVIAEDNKSSGNGGGTLNSGSDNIRTLNTLVYNRNTMASLSSNRLTLQAGTWEIEWRAPAAGDADNGSHQSFLYNQTAGEAVKRGTSEEYNATSGGEMSNASVGSAVVTIAETTAFEIRHRASYSGGTMTGGDSAGMGTEVYTRVIVRAAQ